MRRAARRIGLGIRRRTRATSSSYAARGNARELELLGKEVLVEPVDEHVDRQRDDDEVVELAEQWHAIRHDVPTEGDVAERAAEERLAPDRHALVGDERPDKSRVQRRAARQRHQCGRGDHAPDARAAALGLRLVTVLPVARHAQVGLLQRRLETPALSAGIGKSTSERVPPRTSRSSPHLDIEQPFDMMLPARPE